MLTWECAGISRPVPGNSPRTSIPELRTVCPIGSSCICIAGRGSATSCQLMFCSTAPRSMALPIGRACSLFLLHLPARVRIGSTLRLSVSAYHEAYAVANLRERRCHSEVPYRGGQHIAARMQKRSEIVGFIVPVRQIAPRGAAPHLPLIRTQHKLVVGADVHHKVFRDALDIEEFPEMHDRDVPLRNPRSSNPLRPPKTSSRFRRKLRICTHTGKQQQRDDAPKDVSLPAVPFSRRFFHFVCHKPCWGSPVRVLSKCISPCTAIPSEEPPTSTL